MIIKENKIICIPIFLAKVKNLDHLLKKMSSKIRRSKRKIIIQNKQPKI
jgi:hypothetical protein